MYQTIAIVESDLANRAVCDLIDRSNCAFSYNFEDRCGYCNFADEYDIRTFSDELYTLLTTIAVLENLYERSNYNDN